MNKKEKSQMIQDIYALTPLQEGMLYHYIAEPDSTGYILQNVYDIEFELKENMLVQALKLLSSRFDVLRTVILYEKVKTPRQVVLKEKPIELNVIDLSECSGRELDKLTADIVNKDLNRGFDLQKDSLIRFTYIKCPDNKSKLLFSIHHIIVDGWCNQLLLNKLMEYYSLLVSGAAYDEAAKSVINERLGQSEYKDYINWIQKKDNRAALKYWKNTLGDFEGSNSISPFGKKENCQEQSKEIKFELNKKISSELFKISRENNVTINTVIETLLGILIQKSTGDNDVVIGKVVSGRDADLPGIENIIGLFINTIPLRINNDNDLSFVTMLKRQQQQAIESSEFSYCSLSEIQNLTIQKRNLINFLFAFENYDSFDNLSSQTDDEMDSISNDYSREQTNYDISVTACTDDDIIIMNFAYLTYKYDHSEIQLLIDRFIRICDEVGKNHDIKLSEINCITDLEKEKILSEFNATETKYPSDKTVVELFEEQVERTSDNTALVYENESLTYAELNSRANSLAYKLRELGVKPDDFVAIIADRSIEMIAGIYGILKSGGAYVPIDPTYPEDRIRFMLEDCKPKAVLKYTKESITVPEEIPVIDLKNKEVWEGAPENPEHVNTPNDLIYCIYTSGTTGKPKGVMIENKGVVNLCMNFMNLSYDDTVKNASLLASYAFDASVKIIFSCLLSGRALHIISDECKYNIDKILEYYKKKKIDLSDCTPAHLKMFISREIKSDYSVKKIYCGGEELRKEISDEIIKRNFCNKIINVYGPTEYTVDTTNFDVTDKTVEIRIGKPIANTRVYIMNETRLCGIGVPGELCIAGDGLARGYLNRPELTAEKFVKNPFGEGKMYRSGDLARWLPDGNIEYLGRIDEQVKIRGFRIELGEIENRIREIENIKDCAVIARTDASGEKAICAYYTSEEEVSVSEIRDRLSEALPNYMIPAYMTQIDKIPVTRNGKLDKRALPEIEAKTSNEYAAPQTETQTIICEVFSSVLGVEKVGINDDFFDLGGHSLRATRLVNAIESKTGVRIDLRDVFVNTTPKQLTSLVDSGIGEEYVPIPKAEEKEYYPMTSVQKRTYFIQQMDPESIAYNIPYFMKFNKDADPEKFRDAFLKIIDRHEILRTAFLTIDGEPVQKIFSEVKADFEIIVSDEDDEKLISDFIRPFDLSKPSAVRMRVVDKKDYYLLQVDKHHIISDGMSSKILIDEFSALYNGEKLKPVTCQFKDYSEWMRTKDFSGQAEYWKNQFIDEVPVLEMPTDYARPLYQSFEGAMLDVFMDKNLSMSVDKLVQKTGATEYMIFLACFMITLSKYSRQDDIVVGSPISGRTHKDTESMLGMFVNTLAMRGRPEGNKHFVDFLTEIKNTCINAYENQEYPFEELIEAVNVKRDMSRNPIFDVMLIIQNNEVSNASLNDNSADDNVGFNSTIAKFDLTLNITKADDKFSLNLEYCTALYNKESAEKILSHFIEVVKKVVSDTDVLINEIDMVSEEEREEIISCFNATKTEYPDDSSIVELFEEQTKKTPDNTALVYEGESLTYAELNARANILAHKLRELNVKPDNFVAIIAERSIEMIVGIYAIIKSGGAYVPIDPTYPEERINFMLEDCKPKAVLKYTEKGITVPEEISVIDLKNKKVWEGTSENPEHVNKPNDLAYCIYTSGTTGKPKGVMVEHHGIVNLGTYMRNCLNVAPIDRILLFANYIFDGSVWEIQMALMNGAALYIPNDDTIKDISKMEEYIKQNKISVSYFPPSYFEQGAFALSNYVITAGSQAGRQVVDKALKTSNYINSYGPTEASICSANWVLEKGYKVLNVIPIGKPISNVEIYIMSGETLCGIGVPGELCIAGEGLARGYLNNPELTADKFVKNPFGSGRMYRSGDLARWLPDGNIEYLGRIDDQVKIRGFRIELGEIESRIREIENIRDCAVIAKAGADGEKSICAYYTSEEEVSVSEIRDRLSEALPEYMIPSYMTQIEEIPVTRNGKLDKRALPEINAKSETVYEEPENDKERAICKAFEEILNVENVGRKNSFFELGGDSIKAIRIISRLRTAGYTAAVKDIMSQKTAEKIAQYITDDVNVQKYEQGEVNGRVEKTPIIRIFDKWNFARPEYFNQTTMMTVTGLENSVIRNAVEEIVKHHDILRGVYRDGELDILPVSESKLFDFYEYDYSEEENPADRIEKQCEEIQSGIDLANGPLVKIAVYDIGETKVMMFCVHHLLVDGVSWHILSEDFETAAEQLRKGEKVKLPQKTASFIEWSRQLKEYGETMTSKERNYWKETVSKIESGLLQIPETEGDDSLSVNNETIEFTKETTRCLLEKSGNISGARIDEIMLSSLAKSVRDITKQDLISVRLEGHGREKISDILIDRTVGWFTNAYSVVLESGEDTYENIIKTKETMRKASEWKLGCSFVKGNEAEAEISFNYLGEYTSEENFDIEYSSGRASAEENKGGKGISINGQIYDGQLYFNITSIGDKFTESFVKSLSERFKANTEAEAEYCAENTIDEKTASDYGIYDLTTEEFRLMTESLDGKAEKIYALTPLQEGMLFYNIESEDSTSYVLQSVFKMRMEIDAETLGEALRLLSERYEVLKTAIIYRNIPEPKQVVYAERKPELTVIDLSEEDEFASYTEADVRRGFRLDKDTLLRVTILRRKGNCRILWTIHHIITDGWCSELLFGKLMSYYDKLSNQNVSSADIEAEIKAEREGQGEYSDYIQWMTKQNAEKAKDYWRQLLIGYENNTEVVPMEKPEPTQQQMERIRTTLSEETTNKLISFAEAHQSTINTLSETACGILLQRYAGSGDVVFGKVVSGRNAGIKNIESIVGLFINTIPVRVTAEAGITVTELLERQQKQGMEGTEYDFCSLAEIQGMTPQGADLIKVLYVFENYSSGLQTEGEEETSDDTVDVFDIECSREQTNYGISLSGYLTENQLGFDVMYNPNSFRRSEIELLLERLMKIFESIADNPDQPVSSIAAITDAEKEKILTEFNAAEAEYPNDKTIVELFEEQVEKTSDNTALVYENESLTYAELNAKTNALAHKLRELEVKPDDFVAIIADKSIEMIAGIYGILKSGGAYVPIDPTYPEDRIRFMLEDCKPKAILKYTEESITVPEEIPVINLKNKEIWEGASENPEHVNKPNDLAYCIYTSGTTGKPKGVIVEHYGVANLREYFIKIQGVNENDRVLQFASIAFDAMVSEMTMGLLTGACMYIISAEIQKDLDKFEAYTEENKISIAILPPVYLSQVNLTGFRTIITAGSETNSKLVRENSHIPVYSNDYGPTEATVCATYWRRKSDEVIPERIPIGKPMNNKKIYIMSGETLCGIGVPGELCIAGEGLARGYLNNPELTADKFVKNPFGSGRMYRSGDLARWLPDGNIEYLGRIDDQVKIRGFRIELGEIESRIREIENIRDCAVIAKAGADGEKSICAYYTSEEEVSVSQIRDRLSEALPEYMIPSYMTQIEEIPVTRNGKLDKRALPEINAKSETVYEKPENDKERAICKAFEEILNVENVGRKNSFFELGGDSIKAIRIISRLRTAGYTAAVKDIMSQKTAEKIAQYITDDVNVQKYEQGEVNGRVEKTPIIRIFDKWNFARPEYFNQTTMMTVTGLDNSVIRNAVEEIVKHHDILRGVYRDGELDILPVSESKLFDFYEYDYSEEENPADRIEKQCEEIQSGIDLANGPLVKIAVYDIGETKVMMFCVHHLLVDGVSWHILSEDFETAAEQLRKGEKVKLPQKTASFIEWSRQLKEYGETMTSKERNYWKETVSKIESGLLQIPETEGDDSLSVNNETIEFTKETTRCLLEKSGNISGARIDEIMLSSLAKSVRDITKQDLISVRLEGHGREKISDILIDRTVGWFTNAYSVVLESGEDTYENIIKTKETMRKASEWKLGCSFVKGNEAEAEISFNYLGEYTSEENFDIEYSSGRASAEENKGGKGISINGQIYDGQLYFNITSIGDKFTESFVKSLSERFKANTEAEAEYCAENTIDEKTASDYGIYDLTTEEFRLMTESLDGKAEKIYALTPLQEGMLFYNIESEDSTSYVLQSVFKMRMEIDAETLGEALRLLSERYEVLKTAIIYRNIPEPKQVVYAERKPELTVIDLSEEDEFASYTEADVRRGFRLDKDTLLRVTILRRKGNCRILWTIHHIITDGWCSELLFGRLMSYYDKLSNQNVSSADIEAEIKAEREGQGEYSDYIQWMTKQNAEKAKDYWRQLLIGYENNTEVVPMEKPEPMQQQMERIRTMLSEETTNKLISFTEAHQSTINTLSETACGILLQRYTGSGDVVFGKVVSGRNAGIKNIESIVGLFINTIPVRVTAEAGITVTELLERQQKQGMEGTEYDFCSLAEIQGMTPQGADLIKVLYVFENYSSGLQTEGEEETSGDTADVFDIEGSREQTNYGISLSGYLTENQLGFDVMYNPNSFRRSEIELLLERLMKIFEAIADNPDQPVSSIAAITDAEKEKILTEFNATETEYPNDKTIVELFEKQVEKTPDNIALVFENTSMIYAELNEKANALAHKLRELEVKPDDFVAIIADKSIEMIAGIYGILKSGGAYVPIDPTYPEDRIRFMLEDCNPKAALKYTEESITVPEEIPVIDLKNKEVWEGESENPEHVNKPNDLAYCIYTSGTTGKPKGVILENKSVVNHLNVMREKFYSRDVQGDTPLFTSFAFDFTVPAIFGTLLYGDKLAVMKDAQELADYSEKNVLAVLKITPSYFNGIFDSFKNHKGQVKTIVFGGETLTSETIKNVRCAFGENITIFNEYGPTEATVFTSAAEVHDGELVTIGKPISNSQIYIMNETQLCGIGAPGELCIAGDGLARGYLNRPELTSEKFVKNPYGNGKMYRSGDLARWLPDGNIEYLGRIDEQVKIRGFRIELGEIENRIREIEKIKDCAVIAKADNTGSKAIYAYYTSNEEIKASEIREAVSESLPNYMIPAYMTQIESIPVTQNGKLDKRALPDIVLKTEKEYIPPQTKLEIEVCKILCSVLSVEKISLNDNFFELGGDSLKAIRIISRLREIGYDVAVYKIMQQKLIKQFIDEVVVVSDKSDYIESFGTVEKNSYTEKLIRNSDINKCVQSLIISIDAVEPKIINDILNVLVIHHDILRASYRNDQLELPEVGNGELLDFESYDYSDSEENIEEKIMQKCSEICSSMDIKNGSVLKAAAFTVGSRIKIMIAINQLAADQKSWKILIQDFFTLLGQISENNKAALPDKTNSVIRWSRELNAYEKSDTFPTNRKYWEKTITEISPYTFNLSSIKTSDLPKRIVKRISYDFKSADIMKKINSAFNTEFKELLLSALADTIESLTASSKCMVIFNDSIRGTTESTFSYERTVGRLSVPYPILIEKFSEFDKTIIANKENINSVPNNGLEYAMIESDIDESRYISFNYLGIINIDSRKITLDMYEHSDSPVIIHSYIHDNKLEINIESNGKQCSEQTISNFADCYKEALDNVFTYCQNKNEIIYTASDFDNTMDMDDFGKILDILNGREI